MVNDNTISSSFVLPVHKLYTPSGFLWMYIPKRTKQSLNFKSWPAEAEISTKENNNQVTWFPMTQVCGHDCEWVASSSK